MWKCDSLFYKYFCNELNLIKYFKVVTNNVILELHFITKHEIDQYVYHVIPL